ncbi:MAG: chemotaxis response regulator protein-glutamate methylesterase [Bacteroidales bacterium]|nr:chemotaxis response regulator protein-glutamate methylesterase [Bacteroidales bacterium]MCF8457880.1 chemotaxis response regulator protein-glutamate methylesterase [Bacteroidales bacterium]
MSKEKIKVLIVDDSALVRQSLQKILEQEPSFDVIGTASDPYFAARIIARDAPDVITLDIQMPRMNGLTFLQKIMSQHPIPVVVISSLAKENSDIAIKAWQLGAIDVIEKPILKTKEFFEISSHNIIQAIKAASIANLKKIHSPKPHPEKGLEIKRQYEDVSHTTIHKIANKIVLLGASAGGTEVVAHILSLLPITCPPVVVVQHMPEQFTLAFSRRLDSLSNIKVKEAENGDRLEIGKAYIAPGSAHILLNRKSQEFFIQTNYGPLFNRHRPAVDVLFNSAAEFDGRYFMAAILSGMGRDGVDGLIKLKEKGAMTIAQNEESCIVYGMPKEAIRAEAVIKVLSPEEIVREIVKFR